MLSEDDFVVLDAIGRYQPASQRDLSRVSGISLGKTNQVVQKLAEKALIKIPIRKGKAGKSREGERGKRQRLYRLTPTGAQARLELTGDFLEARLRDCEFLWARLLENLRRLERKGVQYLLIAAPDSLGRLLTHIIRAEKIAMSVVGCAGSPEALQRFSRDSYDCILIACAPSLFAGLIETQKLPVKRLEYLE
ncbi:MAG: hypothetical protein ACLFVT_06730 [Syntrophobacteria bacterium]